MAAVLCLVFLPIFAAVLFMFGAVVGAPSLGGIFALLTFALLGGGIVIGLMNMSKDWESA